MFFNDPVFQAVFQALNTGFLKTLQLFAVTLIGSLPLGLIISFGSTSRFLPLLSLIHIWLRRPAPRGCGPRRF